MDVNVYVDRLMANKKFTTDSAREKTRQALLCSIGKAEAVAVRDEDDDYENAPSEIRYDDSDGVTCRTVAQMEKAEQDRKVSLRARARELFSADELAESEGSVATETDINQKGKWGYTRLHFAAFAGDETECDRLIAAGASLIITDNSGKMPWQKAALKGFDALAVKLKP